VPSREPEPEHDSKPTIAERLAALTRDLSRDPLFAMSLGSKELFHSNLLAWFAEHHGGVSSALTGRDGPIKVHREKLHTDILITAAGQPPLVIENKMFSLPDRAQLDRIAQKFVGQQPELVLLSLSAPAWKLQDPWQWLSYQELTRRLRPTVASVTEADAYQGATLERWLALADRMNTLNSLVAQPGHDEPFLLPPKTRELLASARLDAPAQKMRCQHVAAALARQGVPAVARLTNNLGLVEWFTRAADGLFWGWQLQGEQFRLAMIVPEDHPGNGRSPTHKAARHTEARKHPEMFTFDPINGAGPQGPQRLEFGDYRPAFVYRYVPIPGITIHQAINLGVEYAQRITERLSS
jgi:hypothetical protein